MTAAEKVTGGSFGRYILPDKPPVNFNGIAIIGEAPGKDEDAQGHPFCLEENSLVLRADLTWVKLIDLNIGDEVLTVSENPNMGHKGISGFSERKWEIATVLGKYISEKECYRLVSPNGYLDATDDHTVLATTSAGCHWKKVSELWINGKGRKSHGLCKVLEPWNILNCSNSGYLAGLYDGEGCVTGSKSLENSKRKRRKFDVIFSQNKNIVLDTGVETLRKLGFIPAIDGKSKSEKGVMCYKVRIAGRFGEKLRFLGQVRPKRLLKNFYDVVKSNQFFVKFYEDLKLEEKIPLGIKKVVDIQTTSGTFIANGYVVHNCGQAGKLLNAFLEGAGIDRAHCYVGNVFRRRPPGNQVKHFFTKQTLDTPHYQGLGHVKPDFVRDLDTLVDDLMILSPQLVICLGATALWAITGNTKISQYRGTFTKPREPFTFKVMPTFHPSYILRVWGDQPIVMADLEKAMRYKDTQTTEFKNREIWIRPTYGDLLDYEKKFLNPSTSLSFDIETWIAGKKLGQITSIAFSPSETSALVIPFVDLEKPDWSYWAAHTEPKVWSFVKKHLENPATTKIAQNGSFDISWLARRGIYVRGQYEDTMIAHHVLEPELPKSLDFLASIYCNERAWKQINKTVKGKKDG